MNLPALLDWLDDRINPIVVKELRQAVKSRMVVSILMLFLGLQLFLLLVFLLRRGALGELAADWAAGSDAFMIQQGILLWTIAVVVPAYAAVRLGSERSDHNVDLMFISTLRPASIVWGKFFATFLLGMLVFSTCAPFMTFTYLLRGIDIPTILVVLAIDLLVMCFGIMLGLFVAALPGARAMKFAYAFLGFMGLIGLTSAVTGATLALIGEGGAVEELFDNWPMTLSGVAGVFGLIGLMFSYSVAIVSPHSANRMVPVRLFLLGLVAIALTGALVSSYWFPGRFEFIPLLIFLAVIVPILCLQLWISVCEREQWGPRVRRAIPRRAWLRPFAFLLYTGSAGGVAFTALLTALALGVIALRLNQLPPNPELDVAWRFFLAHLLMPLYAFCYAQTAVLVRHYLLGNQLRSGVTWVIAALLLGVGTAVPPFFAFFIFSDQMRYYSGVGWWYLPNPFVTYMEVVFERGQRGGFVEEFEVLCLWFLLTWTALVTLLSLRWFVKQVAAFRPPLAAPTEVPAEALVRAAASRVGARG